MKVLEFQNQNLRPLKCLKNCSHCWEVPEICYSLQPTQILKWLILYFMGRKRNIVKRVIKNHSYCRLDFTLHGVLKEWEL